MSGGERIREEDIETYEAKEVRVRSMGCIHSASTGNMKKHGPDTDTGGTPIKADPEVHPELLQIAEVSQQLPSRGL